MISQPFFLLLLSFINTSPSSLPRSSSFKFTVLIKLQVIFFTSYYHNSSNQIPCVQFLSFFFLFILLVSTCVLSSITFLFLFIVSFLHPQSQKNKKYHILSPPYQMLMHVVDFLWPMASSTIIRTGASPATARGRCKPKSPIGKRWGLGLFCQCAVLPCLT